MKIVAHRGFWKQETEKNSFRALTRAFENGFGIETDIRDDHGKLVISHNIPQEPCLELDEVLSAYSAKDKGLVLALNIKADGLQELLKQALAKYELQHYFVFDMSIPEQIVYEKQNFIFYTRHSDVEPHCVQYESAQGVWLDSFYDDAWLTSEIIWKHLNNGKKVCIVSPELHGKEYHSTWKMLLAENLHQNPDVMLCTDVPEKAKEYFYEQN